MRPSAPSRPAVDEPFEDLGREADERAGQCPRADRVLARLSGQAARSCRPRGRYNQQARPSRRARAADALLRTLEPGGGDLLAGGWLAERGLAEVLAELRAAGEGAAVQASSPAVVRAVEDGADSRWLSGHPCLLRTRPGPARPGPLDAARDLPKRWRGLATSASHNTGPAHVGLAEVPTSAISSTAPARQVTEGIALCRQFGYPAPGPGLVALAWIRHARVIRPGPGRRWVRPADRPEPGSDRLLNPVPRSGSG